MAEKRQHVDFDSDSEDEIKKSKKSVPMHIRKQDKRLIIVLESANLETIKNGKHHELLNSEDHLGHLKRFRKDNSLCRPDITHQPKKPKRNKQFPKMSIDGNIKKKSSFPPLAFSNSLDSVIPSPECLLMLFDSPLNRAGLLQVYIHSEKNALIEINPQTRIPRTFKRFSGLMVQLLHKFTIRAADGNQRLMKVIKNPITDHLPVGCRKLATSYSSEKIINPRDLVPSDDPIVIVVGAMAHGKLNIDYTEETVSISGYPLSAALTCSKLCSAFEEVWGIQ